MPATISAPGSYCLTGDLVSSASGTAAAITIAADNVQLDMNGHSLLGPGGGTAGYGIYAIAQRGLRVHDGLLRGFSYGVLITDTTTGAPPNPSGASRAHEISGLRVEGATVGISVLGQFSDVHDNVVFDSTSTGIYTMSGYIIGTAGAVNVRRNQVFNTISPTGATVSGIYAGGFGSVVQDNLVSTLRGSSSSAGITAAGSGMIVSNNRETDLGNPATQQTYQYPSSVYCYSGANVAKVSNNIAQLANGIYGCNSPTGYTNDNF
ncbi:MAG TPA: hypothetical protein VFB32_04675 [Rudaea sp.]|nr:hypothetical protein [Rudaea sp.]